MRSLKAGIVARGGCVAQIEGFLEEMVLLCQRSEEYSQFMVAKIGTAAGAAPAEASARETAFRGGAFNMAVRELVSYYMALVRDANRLLSRQ